MGKSHPVLSKVLVATLLAVYVGACATTTPITPDDFDGLELSNPNIVSSTVVSSGQPSAADLAANLLKKPWKSAGQWV
jgi:hypothetical protein